MVNPDPDPKGKPASQVRFTLSGRILKKRYGQLPTITPRHEPEKKRVLVQTTLNFKVRTVGFLDLPTEIRNSIYELIFIKGSYRRLRSLQLDCPRYSEDVITWYANRHIRALDVTIFRANRQIYSEASPVFYRNNRFYFSEDDLPRVDLITCTVTFSKRFHGPFAANLRELTINSLGPSTRRKAVKAALSLLAGCDSLKVLHLVGSWEIGLEEFDLLCNIKQLEEVDFYCIGSYWNLADASGWGTIDEPDDSERSMEPLLRRIMIGGQKPLCPEWAERLKTWRNRILHREKSQVFLTRRYQILSEF